MPRCLVLLLLYVLCAAPPSNASTRWHEARSSNFIVYSDGSEDDLRQSTVRLEEYDALLRDLTETSAPPSPAPLKVYLVGSAGKLRQVANLPEGALGVYMARVGGTAMFAVRGDRPGLGGEEVIFHEYAHHFMSRYYPAAYPAWYREGFAEYLMTTRFLPGRIEVGRFNPGRAVTLLRGSWIPVERIFTTGTAGLSSAQLPQFYAESWLIVHYLFAAPERREALARYLADLHRGVAEATAFQSAFEMDHRGFETALKRYRDGSIAYSVLDRGNDSPRAITIRSMPDAADNLLLRQAALNIGIADPSLEAETVAAIQATAARYPNDPFALRVLARSEIGSGDRAAGTAMIDRLLGETTPDAELFYYRGLADFFAGRKDESQRIERYAAAHKWFAKAVEVDPHHYTALYRLALTAPLQAANASDEVTRQLIAAHQLAPLVGDIAIDTASALAAERRFTEAETAILPVATNPHGGNSEQARSLLSSIRQQAKAAR